MKLKPWFIIIVAVLVVWAVSQQTPDSSRLADLSMSRSLSMATQDNLHLGRELSLNDNGQVCAADALPGVGLECFTCDEDVDANPLAVCTTEPGCTYTITNTEDYPISWQVWRIESNNAWSNLCGPAGPSSVQPNCDIVDRNNGSINLAPHSSSSFFLDTQNNYVEKVFNCNGASPRSCADPDALPAYAGPSLGDSYKVATTVTVTYESGPPTDHPDACEGTTTLHERTCESNTVATLTQNCLDYGTGWFCNAGACSTCVPNAVAKCDGQTPTYYDSCGTKGDPKSEACDLYGQTCHQEPVDGNMDAWCVNPNNPEETVTAFINPLNDEEYCLKQSNLSGADSCLQYHYPRKTGVTSQDIDQLSLTQDLKSQANPVCINDYGHAQCAQDSTCVPANKPVNDNDKDVSSQIYRVFQQQVFPIRDSWVIQLTQFWVVKGVELLEKPFIEQHGVCMVGGQGLFSGLIESIASTLGVSTQTATLILVGLGLLLVVLLFMPRRQS